jgi:hypothetical protein
MEGIVIISDNYTYEGGIENNFPHGNGMFEYSNGDVYTGECAIGKLDGFGTYVYKTGEKYTGFYSFSKMNGIGTFEDATNIYKGHFRFDMRHGRFYKTNKILHKTKAQLWCRGKLISSKDCQYIPPSSLQTYKANPLNTPKKYQVSYRGDANKKCIACYDRCANSTNVNCGHVSMCYDCLCKCDKCPICRSPMTNILKLYVS